MRIQNFCILLTLGLLSANVYGNLAGAAVAVDIAVVD